MASYKVCKRLSSEDAAYIAGIIDGEGTITLSRRHKKDNRQLVVTISNTEVNLLKWIKETVGAGRITRKRTYHSEHTPSFTYTVENRQALTLIEQIADSLRTYKASRARLLLDRYVTLTPRNGKYTPELAKERLEFEEQLLEVKPNFD